MKNLESKCLGIIDNLTLKDLFKAAEDDLSNFNIERCMGAAIVFTLTLTWPNFEVNSREVHFLLSGYLGRQASCCLAQSVNILDIR